jgi:hypothetical protein
MLKLRRSEHLRSMSSTVYASLHDQPNSCRMHHAWPFGMQFAASQWCRRPRKALPTFTGAKGGGMTAARCPSSRWRFSA